MSKQEKYPFLKIYIIPFALLLMNIAIRVFNVRFNSLGAPEAFNLFHSEFHVSKILSNMTTLNNPPLYIIFLKIWTFLNGINEGWIRLPSVIFISITSVFIYDIGRKFISFQVGLFSAIAFSCSTNGFFFSHEASTYALLTMLTTLSMYFYLRILKNPDSQSNNSFLLIVNLLLVYSHFYGITIIISQILFLLLISRNQDKVIVNVLRSNLILFLLSLPGIWIFFKRISFIRHTGSWLSRPSFDFFYDGFTNFANESIIAAVFLGLMLLAYLLYKFKTRTDEGTLRTAWKLIPLWFFIPYLLIFIFSFWIPIFQARNMIFIGPALYLTVGIALSYIFKKQTIVQYCFMTLLVIAMVGWLDINPAKKNRIRETERLIKRAKTSETAVVMSPYADFLAFAYYYNRNYFKMCNHTEELMNSEHVYFAFKPERIDEIAKTPGVRDLIYYQTGIKWDVINEKINKVLLSNYTHVDQLYSTKPAVYRFYN